MAPVAIVFGIALSALGGWLYYITEMASLTALIPAFFGLPLIVCGVLALNENRRKHAMHAAAVIGLLGFLAPLGRLIPTMIRGTFELNTATQGMLAMMALCLVFVVLCVKSFIDARIARKAKEAAERP